MTEHSVEEFIPGLTHRDRGVRVSAARLRLFAGLRRMRWAS